MMVGFVPKQHKMMLNDMMEYYHIQVVTDRKIVEVTEQGALIQMADGSGKEELLEADTVVMSIGLRPNPSLAQDYQGKNIAVYEIGSAKKAGDIYTAVHEAFEVAYYLD